MWRLVVAALACGSVSACGGVCTKNLVFSLSVRVTDASTDAGICDANVDVSDGTFMARLDAFDTEPASCEYFGVGERPGTYRIDIRRSGYLSATVENVVVSQGACHVMPQKRDVALRQAP